MCVRVCVWRCRQTNTHTPVSYVCVRVRVVRCRQTNTHTRTSELCVYAYMCGAAGSCSTYAIQAWTICRQQWRGTTTVASSQLTCKMVSAAFGRMVLYFLNLRAVQNGGCPLTARATFFFQRTYKTVVSFASTCNLMFSTCVQDGGGSLRARAICWARCENTWTPVLAVQQSKMSRYHSAFISVFLCFFFILFPWSSQLALN